jgi:triacylglycerol lipase
VSALEQLLTIPIWREGRALLEAADLRRRRAGLAREVPRGCGESVLLIPGYTAGDGSLAPLAGWLRELGYAPQHAGIAANVDCATRTAERLVERLKTITAAHADRTVIVGHSLGGVLGRLLAVQRPDLVRGVICLGSPLVDSRAVHPMVWAHVQAVGALAGLGVPGLLSRACLSGGCCAESRGLLQAPVSEGVDLVSVYSRRDGVVDWRSCRDPEAEQVEVDSTHVGMAMNAAVYRLVAERISLMGDSRRLSTQEATMLAAPRTGLGVQAC